MSIRSGLVREKKQLPTFFMLFQVVFFMGQRNVKIVYFLSIFLGGPIGSYLPCLGSCAGVICSALDVGQVILVLWATFSFLPQTGLALMGFSRYSNCTLMDFLFFFIFADLSGSGGGPSILGITDFHLGFLRFGS